MDKIFTDEDFKRIRKLIKKKEGEDSEPENVDEE